MEELTGQIAEALPGGVALFAEAYQRQLAAEGRGGGKTGNEAIQELRAAMERREVRGDILLYAGARAGEMAQPSLAAASRASQAEQSRFQNAYNSLAQVASNAGVEGGFARLFRSLTIGAKESAPFVESLARGFDEMTKYISVALLSFQSLQRFFQGRDSFLGDKLFPEKEDREAAFKFITTLKGMYEEMANLLGNVAKGWKMIFASIDWGTVLNGLSKVSSVLQNILGALNAAIAGNYGEAWSRLKSAVGTATEPVKAGINAVQQGAASGLARLDPRVPDDTVFRPLISSSGSRSDLDYKTEQSAQRQLAAAQARKDGFQQPTGIFPMKEGAKVTATFHITGVTNPDEVGEVVRVKLEDMFRAVNAENPEAE